MEYILLSIIFIIPLLPLTYLDSGELQRLPVMTEKLLTDAKNLASRDVE
jgi:hypothetical protein